jgi:hypothetical protein
VLSESRRPKPDGAWNTGWHSCPRRCGEIRQHLRYRAHEATAKSGGIETLDSAPDHHIGVAAEVAKEGEIAGIVEVGREGELVPVDAEEIGALTLGIERWTPAPRIISRNRGVRP